MVAIGLEVIGPNCKALEWAENARNVSINWYLGFPVPPCQTFVTNHAKAPFLFGKFFVNSPRRMHIQAVGSRSMQAAADPDSQTIDPMQLKSDALWVFKMLSHRTSFQCNRQNFSAYTNLYDGSLYHAPRASCVLSGHVVEERCVAGTLVGELTTLAG